MNMLPFTRPTLDEEELESVSEVLKSGWITSGPRVIELEKELASYVGGGVEVQPMVMQHNSTIAKSESSLFILVCVPGPVEASIKNRTITRMVWTALLLILPRRTDFISTP